MNIWESLANCKSGAQLRKTTQFCMFGKVWLIVSLVLRRMIKRTHFVNILESLANCKSGATDEGLWPLVAGLVQPSLTDEISTGRGCRLGGEKECLKMFFQNCRFQRAKLFYSQIKFIRFGG